MNRTLAWTAMTLAAIAVAAYALALAIAPAMRGEFVDNMVATAATGSILHFLAGTVVIIVGALQFNTRIRTRYPQVHRWMGRLYVAGVVVGSSAGFYLAFFSFGGVVTHFGFGLLAVCWLATTLIAFTQIRAGLIHSHQNWMMRSYALCLAAVTLRIYLPLFLLAGVPFEEAYLAIAWLCWVPNLLVAEWFLIPHSRSSGKFRAGT